MIRYNNKMLLGHCKIRLGRNKNEVLLKITFKFINKIKK